MINRRELILGAAGANLLARPAANRATSFLLCEARVYFALSNSPRMNASSGKSSTYFRIDFFAPA